MTLDQLRRTKIYNFCYIKQKLYKKSFIRTHYIYEKRSYLTLYNVNLFLNISNKIILIDIANRFFIVRLIKYYLNYLIIIDVC